MTTLPFTARAHKSGRGFILWLPKVVSEALKLNGKSLVIVQIGKSKRGVTLPFTAKVAKSGRGFLLWIPKAVSTGLKLKDKNLIIAQINKIR